ncbi:hypothetical protein PAP_03780 [Palaeococcus pacificus DY20341]|uniref:BPL/LPL catalytic domain-containing protein n=1 Tax=Palaeococcus pacificus DY20341 TaxID=1343739 RepID=A0A075LR27_9EURY|nr:biotin--[acetyl-CoA-carboxylase] ligase [Palaeococcus pacificus]AIF69175.1 hypothetical protein PAP_03780 [Palaeococcus pacificus DY20341]
MIGLTTRVLGKKVIYFQEISSTNEYAKNIAMNEEEGTVIVADIQSRGHGRKARMWVSPKGGLWMSVILKPKLHPEHLTKLVFIGALAVVETLEAFGIEAKIKWPNDVLIEGKKVCGILAEGKYSESEIDYVVLGIGLNVNIDKNDLPENIRMHSISLKEVLGAEIPIEEVFKVLIRRLEHWYAVFKEEKYEDILQKWREYAILGRKVRIIREEGEIEGVALGVDELGALIVETSTGKREKIIYGDVSLRYA